MAIHRNGVAFLKISLKVFRAVNHRLLFFCWLISVFLAAAGNRGNGRLHAQVPGVSVEVVSDKVTHADLVQLEQKVRTWLPKVADKVVSLEGGSGVIVTRDGWVLTAAHVSGVPGRKIKVRLANGVLWPAKTYGVNWEADTGLVRLLGDQEWPYLKPAEGTKVKPGQWCMVFGYPWNDKNATSPAVRIGRVSAVSQGRIVSDTPVVGGDSGGPVLNLAGQVVGINSKIRMDVQHNIHVSVKQFVKDWGQLIQGNRIAQDASSSSIVDVGAIERHGRNSLPVQAALSLPLTSNRSSVVRISRQSTAQASVKAGAKKIKTPVLGTILTRSGLVVGKLSELVCKPLPKTVDAVKGQRFKCLVSGQSVWASVLAIDNRIDLALLQLDSKAGVEFEPVGISETQNEDADQVAGRICVSMVAGDNSKWAGSLGAIMVPVGDFQVIVDRQEFDLGALFDDEKGLRVQGVFPGSMAAMAGVRIGDRIEMVGVEPVKTEAELAKELAKAVPKTIVQLTVRRSGQPVLLGFEIPAAMPMVWDRWGGGPFSQRRFGFGDVIAHDGNVLPADCGGPLLDLQGKAMGVNVSRAMRNTTYAIPIDTVIKFVRECRPDVQIGR